LLLFRKAESGMDQVKPVRLNICNFCKEVYLCFVQQAKAKNIAYHFECSNDTLEIYADPQKLEIILYNLLSNALKYTPDAGSIRLEVLESEAAAEIVVTDTGVGIPKAAGARLFEKFYQPERKNNAGKEGFGIGLYLVKHFTEQHHGAIAYQSEDGKRTTFTLHLPKGWEHFGPEMRFAETAPESYLLEGLKEVAEAEQMVVPEEVGQPMVDVVTEKQTILLVDDDEQILQYLTRLFQDIYVVHQAARGDEGVKMAQKYLPDLIITDVHMQGISGIDLCKIIKDDPTLSHIPVILLTASSSDEVKLQGVEGGADDYITKPFDNKFLLARVTSLLKSRTTLQKYFYNEITFNHSNQKISPEYKQFLDRCIAVVENHLDDDQFGVKTLVSEMGMSHSSLLRRVKSISGQPVNVFIRFIRLRKAAELFINTDYNVNETAFMVGMKDTRYFQKQFYKLFGLNPSEYIKKFRKIYGKQYTIDKDSINPE
jgi:DNA-binding response OmpR family regulator/anti-sigma regulatory factor (Ser/Thr protein kinase)